MVKQHNEDEGWKVNIITNIDKSEADAEETVALRTVWSRKKKIMVLLALIILVFGVSAGLLIHILGGKKETEDEFIKYVKAGAYARARYEYIRTDEDVEKYSEFVENYFEELVNVYNETSDDVAYDAVRRYEEVYDYKFDINSEVFYALYDSKYSYKYGLSFYKNNDFSTAYEYLKCVIKEDSNYESAQKYMAEMKELLKNELVTINIWYTNKQEKLIAQKLEEIYNNSNEMKLYNSEFKYKLVNEEDVKKGMPEGECGIVFTGNDSYDNDEHVYSTSTDILVYNMDYYEKLQVDSMNAILERNIDVPNIYIPLTDGKFLSGLLSTYNGSIYREEMFEGDKWVYSGDYSVVIGEYELEYLLNYARELNNNQKVYTAEDGIEKFANGEIAAAIISSDDYEGIKARLGNKLGVAKLPKVSVKGIDLSSNSIRLQGVNKYRTMKFVCSDNKSSDVVYKFGDGIYTDEFSRYILEEFDLYNELGYTYGKDDKYIDIVGQQCMENLNNINYYDEQIKMWMDEMAAFTRKATSEEEILNYIDSTQWIQN